MGNCLSKPELILGISGFRSRSHKGSLFQSGPPQACDLEIDSFKGPICHNKRIFFITRA